MNYMEVKKKKKMQRTYTVSYDKHLNILWQPNFKSHWLCLSYCSKYYIECITQYVRLTGPFSGVAGMQHLWDYTNKII